MIHLECVSLSIRLVPSTIPELWGLYAVCNFHLMFKVLPTCYTKSATKALSDPMLVGNANLAQKICMKKKVIIVYNSATFR